MYFNERVNTSGPSISLFGHWSKSTLDTAIVQRDPEEPQRLGFAQFSTPPRNWKLSRFKRVFPNKISTEERFLTSISYKIDGCFGIMCRSVPSVCQCGVSEQQQTALQF